MATTTHHLAVPSPLGALHLGATDEGLVAVAFGRELARDEIGPDVRHGAGHPVIELARRELDAYFAGALTAFTVPRATFGTPFQRAVWDALVAIPFGERRAYQDVARAIGRLGAERAVGAANGQNPIAIVVPCHRVIGKGGALTGYAGGLDIKRWLLAHEARVRPGALLAPRSA